MSGQPFSLSWSDFTWWISDNKYQAMPWRYWTSYNMNTRKYNVSPSADNPIVYTYPTLVNSVYNVEQVWWWDHNIIWCDSWKIYYDSTEVKALTNGKQWHRIATLKVWWVDKLYYFHDTLPWAWYIKYIHRSNIDWTWFDEWYFPWTKATYTSNDWNPFLWPANGMQVVAEWDRILFSHYNHLFEMDNAEIITDLITFPSWENIVWITEFQWEYKIYTTIWFITSKLYTWDWTATAPSLSIPLNGIPIWWVVNNWAYDYITSLNQSMYKVAWVQYQKLYDKIWVKVLTNINWLIYWWIANKNNEYWIFTYGSLPWYPDSLVSQYVTDSAAPTSNYISDSWNMAYSSNYTYYAVYKSLYKIWWTTTVDTTSYIESLFFTGTNIEHEKSIDMIVLKFAKTTANCYIRLEAQTQDNSAWIKLYEWNNVTIGWINQWCTIYNSRFLNNLWTFNKIRFKVSFISDGATSW